MNNSIINKFENEKRLLELNPIDTLLKAGFNDDSVLCDIGAGTGIFSFPAAEISNDKIYALEISDEMIDILNKRKTNKKTKNLLIKKVESKTLPLPDKICDMVCLITVLHEIKEKELMINEIKRILKRDGRLLVVDFHKKETPMGPPVNCRISIEGLCSLLKRKGLKIADKIIEGDNFYGLVFEM